jgi:amino acid permease
MRRRLSIPTVLAGTIGVVLIALGIVYLTVACENLPTFLGPHAGDTSPRTGLGIVGVTLGLVSLVLALIAARRRPSTTPLRS